MHMYNLFACNSYRRVHIILQSTSFYWRDAARQNGALKATLSKYLVDFDIVFQRCNNKETH